MILAYFEDFYMFSYNCTWRQAFLLQALVSVPFQPFVEGQVAPNLFVLMLLVCLPPIRAGAKFFGV